MPLKGLEELVELFGGGGEDVEELMDVLSFLFFLVEGSLEEFQRFVEI